MHSIKILIEIIFCKLILEIVGTKDYREPEWVSEMEEMREALAGNYSIHYEFKYIL
jgi:hypothetical protein